MTESNLRTNVFISLPLIIATQADRRSALAFESLSLSDGAVGTFYRGTRRDAELQSSNHIRPRAIRISSLDVRPILAASRARTIYNSFRRLTTGRSFVISSPRVLALSRVNSSFFLPSLFRRKSDTRKTTAMTVADNALNADMHALNAAGINIPYSSVREIAVRYGS